MALRKETIRNRFRKAGFRQGWWTTDHPVLAAVSGGGDSVALLWMLKTFWKGTVVVAHLEHGIRGDNSLRDALFVQELAKAWKIKANIGHRNIPQEKRRGESIEDCARRIRYEFLEDVRTRHSARWVLLGHNANDIAETMLFHLLRGTGLRGLVGIPETRDCYARPLVDFQRQELRTILVGENISWCEDETNKDNNYTRNFIRNNLIPLIQEKVNPAAEKHLSALSREIALLVEEQELETSKALQRLRCSFPTAKRTWRQEGLAELKKSTLSLCIRQEARELGFPVLERERTSQLVDLMLKGGRWRFQWKEDLEVCCGSRLVGWIKEQDVIPEKTIHLSKPQGETIWGNWHIQWGLLNEAQEHDRNTSGIDPQLCVNIPFSSEITIRDRSQVSTGLIPYSSVPWWAEKGWPVLFIGSTMSWSPSPENPCGKWLGDKDHEKWVSISHIGNKQNGSEQPT